MIAESGDCIDDEIRKRLAMGRAALVGLDTIWKRNENEVQV